VVAAKVRQDLRQEWNEKELRLAVLQVLLGARKISPQHGGATGKQLMDALQIDSARTIESTIWYLHDQQLVSTSERVFQITANGVDYVEKHSPGCTPFSRFSEEPPQSASGQDPPQWSPDDGPGPWPPRRDPDDPSNVPKNRKPSGSAGAIALPLPEPEQFVEPQP